MCGHTGYLDTCQVPLWTRLACLYRSQGCEYVRRILATSVGKGFQVCLVGSCQSWEHSRQLTRVVRGKSLQMGSWNVMGVRTHPMTMLAGRSRRLRS